jgi:hypothetical protein
MKKTMPSLHRLPNQLDLRRRHSAADKSHVNAFSVAMTSTGRRPVPARRRPTSTWRPCARPTSIPPWCAAARWTARDRTQTQGTRPLPPRHRLRTQPPSHYSRSVQCRVAPSRPGLTCPTANQESPPLEHGRSATGTPSRSGAAGLNWNNVRSRRDDAEGRNPATRSSTGCSDTPRYETPQYGTPRNDTPWYETPRYETPQGATIWYATVRCATG